ncbi:MAG: hypothetical protein O2865_16260 [Planctomycetota bacterium]|nr:hypothetical protein [Planctomycetota bacterium]MDA0934495.1 hypothetical protein [Planctomycetota bacterium]
MRALLEFLLLAWMALGFFAWILRDGLGPDSTTSTGLEAVSRTFWTFWWGPSGLLLAGLWLLATKRGAQSRAAAARENA